MATEKTVEINATDQGPDVVSVPDMKAATGSGDIALKLLEATGGADVEVLMDKQTRRRVMRKIDRLFLPIMAITEMLQFLDKSTLSYAAIFGIREDTGLVGTDYAWLSSIFYFGYLVSQPLSGVALQKFPAPKCLAVCVLLWSIILFLHATCSNWGGLMTVRFLLGLVEGLTFPAFMLITNGWYPRKNQSFRMGFWFSFNGTAQILGGLLSYGLGNIRSGIASWKWMFLVTGALSFFWAIFIWFAVPDSQLDAGFLTESEKRTSLEMIRSNNTGIHNKTFKKEQMIEALTDVKTWVFFMITFLINIPNSVVSFGTLVISGFGFTSLQTTLLSMPAGAFEFVIVLVITWACSKYQNARTWSILVALLISLLGSLLMLALPYDNKAGLLSGYYIIYAYPIGYLLLLALITANTAGHTKKITTNAICTIGYSIGNIAAPQFYKSEQAPHYALGIGSLVVSLGLSVVSYLLAKFYLAWLNKKREPARLAAVDTAPENIEFMDLTDKQNPLFVYVY
ncbi:MFS transporter [Xylariomycetidae sp. FL2044]|nr:MFS transporter [Xylariomycetidae sp. FL2044]